ncbi:helix-turn-helix domain-containing protein [Candidatus Peregrinibacteria bacterium]|nr:helix-turn-helix domain-containing protein [Candidatus Peregrinibacteria bacterium]
MNDKYIRELAETITSIKDVKLAMSFLSNILTPAELEEISKRLQIVKLLNNGVPQRDVAKKLGVSMGTVSRGSRELKYGEDGFRKILKKN